MPNTQLNFYSWVRRGLAAGLTDAGANLKVAVTASSSDPDVPPEGTADVGLTLVAPEDIISFDPRCIVKKRPDANTLDAEYEPYAMVEFDQPDLPWRYTPEAATEDGTLKPWLALIVLEEGEIVATKKASESDGKLATVTVNQQKLPDLSKVPYWAHTQVTGTTPDGLNDDLMANAPHKLVSRLICGRQMEENKTHYAYLVPTFEGGRCTPLDQTADDPHRDAWNASSNDPVELPIYYQWSFKTGNVGSFKQLALRLRPGILPSTIGWRAIDVSAPGLVNVPAAKDSDGQPVPMQVEGALQSPSAKDRGNVPTPDEDEWVGALKNFIERQSMDVDDPSDPSKKLTRKVVAPPLYGRWHANQNLIPDKDATKPDGWFRVLNVNPTLRVAAALGTAVIQKEQEPLMASAWRQAGELPAINRALKVLQLGCESYARSYERNLKPLSDKAFLQRIRSLHGKVPFRVGQGQTISQTVAGAVQETSLCVGVLSGAWRRLARARGKLGRLGRQWEWSAFDWVNNGNWIGRPWDGLSGGLTFDDILTDVMVGKTDPDRAMAYQAMGTDWLELWGLACFWVGRQLLETKQGHYWWLINRLIQFGTMLLRFAGIPGWTGYTPWPPPTDPADVPPVPPPQSYPPPVSPGESAPLTPIEYLDPKRTLPWQFWRNARIDGSKRDSIDPIMAAPAFPQPMYEPLRDLSKDWVLPGISDVGGNTVAIALTNQKFIEAYMVGLNQEMARELVWRDYPTDRRGSYFRQFWDTRGRVASNAPPNSEITDKRDIQAINEWTVDDALGSHRPTGSGAADDQVVLMVRGDLVARYPNVVVYARMKDHSVSTPLYTVFQGLLPPDVGFYGFNLSNLSTGGADSLASALAQWEFVIQERPGELRFAKPDDMTDLELVPDSGDPQYLYATDHSGHSFAVNTIRRPTRVVIDGSDLVTSA